MQVSMSEARKCLSSLIAAAEHGEDVFLFRNGKPVAKIVRYQAPKVKPPGSMRGRIKVWPDWNSREANAESAALFAGVAEPAVVVRRRG